MMTIENRGSYANVNGLHMYYEVHGQGRPLFLLPGAVSGVGTAFGRLIPLLAADRQIIALEFQGYGHTADIPERPLSYEQWADDVIALTQVLDIQHADFFGYSTGAGVALQIAMRQPALVGKLILASCTFNSKGRHPQLSGLESLLTPEGLKGTPYETEYLQTAPQPQDWPKHLAKVTAFNKLIQDWPADDIRNIKAPALIIAGDADIVQPEHAVELYRLLGGGSLGELSMPASQLAILPGTMHTALTTKTELLMTMIPDFLKIL
ncbi:alpha/beta fold hydrolase [Chitinophaga varians]|uniref:alpha/beta fold hydrolase n=1 Tax=Chitinophaga varians TaxID=2202339 RepID=UPI00165F5A04|nr:alpha/beta hydrolase [Chitinophaga varians]MBC9912563.1 alpha/beta hydrolase [Chitinophaga varians]